MARAGALGLILLGALFAVVAWYARDLPPLGDLDTVRKQPRITLLDRHGEVIGIHGQDHGEPIRIEDLPDHVVSAFLVIEDRNFYHHVGINPIAILRALTINMREGEIAQGGSTITQQLVKNLVLSPDQTLERKVQEMLLALKIEFQYNKDEILALYLNRVYFGNGAYGLEAAARRYYDKSPHQLTVGEAAMLAGLLKAPSRLSPTNSLTAARQRAKIVLQAMVETGDLKADEAQRILAGGIAEIVEQDLSAGYAIDHAVAEARQYMPGLHDDLTISTTLDKDLITAVARMREDIAKSDPLYKDDVQTAILILDEEGAIRVLIGGNDYRQTVYNRATLAERQPGSVFKPFVYLTAIERGWYPEDLIDDDPVQIGNYQPTNYKNRYYHTVSITEALSRSLNAAAIRLQEQVGRHRVIDLARRVGFDDLTDTGPAIALGVMQATPLKVAEAYLPMSNGGFAMTPYVVDRIETESGKLLYEHPLPKWDRPIIDDLALVRFDHMMRYVISDGSGRAAQVPGHFAAGKTGTSQDSRDAWFAGYASGFVGVVWMGKDDNSPMEWSEGYISGSGAPAKLWGQMMSVALEGRVARIPRLYEPREQHRSFLDHLASLLGGGSDKRDIPPAAIGTQVPPSSEDMDDLFARVLEDD